jgi:Tol biopolymer transport system component
MDSTSAPLEPSVYTIKHDGTERVRLASPTYAQSRPTWSPDGEQLAFRTNTRIAIVDAEGRTVELLTPGTYAEDLTWSSDGGHIAFSETCPGNHFPLLYYCTSMVTMIRVGSVQLAPVTEHHSHSPAWVP